MFKTIVTICIISFALLEAVSGISGLYKGNDDKEYFIETEPQYNWFEASNACARKKLQLIALDSRVKNNAIIELLKKVEEKPVNIWLGGTDEYKFTTDEWKLYFFKLYDANAGYEFQRPFFWSGTGERITLTNWSKNNPDNYDNVEHCVHIWHSTDYQWNDNECTHKMGFICEEKN